MLTLKILWKEKQDIRRVQLLAVNQALAALDNRVADNWNELAFRDLRDYVLLVFPELKDPELDVLLYYMDDDDEQVRITNDAELAEGFRLMQEMAQAAGKDPSNAVCKIIVAARPVLAASTRLDSSEAVLVGVDEALASSSQQKKASDLFVDLSKVVEKWEASAELATLKRDLLSILHEPGCQEALLEVMANEKFTSILQTVTEEFQAGGDYLECLVAVAGTGNLEEIAKLLLQKCPHSRVQVERVLQEVQRRHNVKMMSTSDFFENISSEETKQDLGPVVAVFEGDITCPDGSILPPNQPFDKVWKLRNGGPTKWPAGAVLSCVGGDKMQAPDHVLIPSVKPGHSIDVSLRMVTPVKPGRYTGYWRLSTPDGNRFGQRLWVDINVADPSVAEEAAIRVDAPAPLVQKHEEPAVSVPAPAPVAAAPARKKVDFKWRVEIESLADMGFTDEAKNAELLEEHSGNLEAVINALL